MTMRRTLVAVGCLAILMWMVHSCHETAKSPSDGSEADAQGHADDPSDARDPQKENAAACDPNAPTSVSSAPAPAKDDDPAYPGQSGDNDGLLPSSTAIGKANTKPTPPESGSSEERNTRRRTLGDAVERGDLAAMARLRGQGVPVGMPPEDDDFAPVHRAAIAGRLDSLQWLHQNGADLNARIGEGLLAGFTPLDLARHFNHPTCVAWLQQQASGK